MASSYPGALDNLATTRADDTPMFTTHANDHNDANDALNKIEAELGINPSGTSATVAARLTAIVARLDEIQPVAPDSYSVTNTSTDRVIDGSSTTIAEILNVLGTLITDLQARGVVG
jgi:hypothetical protein